MASRNSLNFTLIQEFFSKLGVRLNSFIELGSFEATKELAKLGIGVAITACWNMRQEIEAGQQVAMPISKIKQRRSWIASSNKGRVLHLPERMFIALCEEVGRRMK